MGKRFLIALNLLLACISMHASGKDISFRHLTVENGLSSITVNDIQTDSMGVVWLATGSGLDRYDGNEITPIPAPAEINQGNPIIFTKQLALDGNGILDILYSTDICALNTLTGEIVPVVNGHCNYIHYSKGLWIACNNQLLYLPGPESPVKSVFTLPKGEITSIMRTSDGTIWLGCADGKVLILGNKEDGSLHIVDQDAAEGLFHDQILNIKEDSRGTIYIGTISEGALAITKAGQRIRYRHDTTNPNSISSDYVRSFCEDNLGDIWIGTFTGLDRLTPASGKIRRFHPEPVRPDAISHNSVWGLHKDSQGTIWAGTYYGGVNYFNPEYEIYTRYPGLSSPIISKILKDGSGNLWIATEGGGLNCLNRKTGEIRWFNTDSRPGEALSENNVKDIFYSPEEESIWAALHMGGVNRIDIRSGKVRVFKANPAQKDALPSNDVLKIADYGDSVLVVTKSVAAMMDKRTGRCRNISLLSSIMQNDISLRHLMVDNGKNIWLFKPVSRCLVKLAPPYSDEIVYSHSSADFRHCPAQVGDITQDAAGKIWLVSKDEGLCIYNTIEDTFVPLWKESAFPAVVHVAASPASGNVIYTSDNGFFVFDPVTHTVKRYGKENGFPFENGLVRCITVLEDSEIYLGGYNGLVSVNEKNLDIPRKPYRLFFTHLFVNGEKVEESGDILSGPLFATKSVTLPPGTLSVELTFSSSNHIEANQDPVEYKLEGFDKSWHNVRGEKHIAYTNLSPGSYRLAIRPAYRDSDAVCEPAYMDIRIRPHWYASWWAYLFYFLVSAAIISILISFNNGRIQMRELARSEKERAENQEKLNQAKLSFFTDISHEIRTPLTIIIAEVESIIQQHNFTPSLYKKVLGIYKNSIALRELIGELLEFRKQEQGQLKIKVSPHNLSFFVGEFFLLFNEYAESKGIHLSLEKATERLEVWYDQNQMQKVLNNILANAMKFTPRGGSVSIRLFATDASAVIEIADTGCGIPEKELDHVFHRFYQAEAHAGANTGTGIGLALAQGIVQLHSGKIEVESTEGKGTLFRVSLPLGYSHFSKEQLEENPSSTDSINLSDKVSLPSPPHDTPDVREAEAPGKGHTIVVAEDNNGVLDMLVELFSPFYKVIPASDGEAALEAVRNHMPSLVVSDVMMPLMSGTELCKVIKSDPTLCHIPVVLLTARVDVEQNLEGLQQGADDYVTKPFNSRILLSRCNNLVNSRILLQEKFGREPVNSTWMLATNRLDKEFIDKVLDILGRNLSNSSFDINQLVKEMGMSRTAFFEKLKAISGQSPSKFIQTIRLKESTRLLLSNPELNINDIADMTGFNTPKYFAKCFKERYGQSPLAWRKEMSEKQAEV